jgi:hypothetical protein
MRVDTSPQVSVTSHRAKGIAAFPTMTRGYLPNDTVKLLPQDFLTVKMSSPASKRMLHLDGRSPKKQNVLFE